MNTNKSVTFIYLF